MTSLIQPSPDRLRHHLDRLCDLGGRLSGTHGEAAALDYVESTLAGLRNGRAETLTHRYLGWRCNEALLTLEDDGHRLEALPGSPSTKGALDLEIVDAGRGTPEDIAGLGRTVAGRAVLVTHEYMFAPGHVHRSSKFEAARAAGAAAFIIGNPWPDSGVVVGGTNFGEPHDLPAIGVSFETAEALRAASVRRARIRLTIDVTTAERTTRTLLWHREGMDQGAPQRVLTTAHIDGHRPAESAIDNASGTAVALALAEAVDASSLGPGRDVSFAFFSIEEWGLLASRDYVAALNAEDREAIALVVNLDSVGGDDRLTAMTSGFDALAEQIRKIAPGIGIHPPLTRNSDHYNFAAAGIPALRLIAGFGDPASNLRHVLTSSDRRDLISTEQLMRAADFAAAMVIAARDPANSYRRPRRDAA